MRPGSTRDDVDSGQDKSEGAGKKLMLNIGFIQLILAFETHLLFQKKVFE